MIKKVKKLVSYLRNYRRNRVLLRMMDDYYTFPLFAEQYRISLKYANHNCDSAEKSLSSMVIKGHSIEKGLANNEIRLGFGQKKVIDLALQCNSYLSSYTDSPSRLEYVIGILKEYDCFHREAGFILEQTTQNALDSLFANYNHKIVIPETKKTTRQEYFANVDSSFVHFAYSRHSVRDFTGEPIEESLLKRAFQLAQQAPSTCNRQSVRVYCVYNESLRHQLVDLQNHGRGFADKANPLLVITVEMQDWDAGEQWFGCYLDSGIYLMNLLYALHFYRVAAIPLNWYADISANQIIRELLSIPESQVPVAIVACGTPKEEFKLVTSQRRDSNEIVVYLR